MPPSPPDDEWVCKHYARIRRAAWLLIGDAWGADDLVQETFVRAIEKWEQYDGRASEATWLYSILLNVHRSQRRSYMRAEQLIRRWILLREDSNQYSNDPRYELAERMWKESVWARVRNLPIAQQQSIFLRFGEDMSFDEIAKLQKCAVGTAQTRVHYGLKKLRLEMESIDWAPPSAVWPVAPTLNSRIAR